MLLYLSIKSSTGTKKNHQKIEDQLGGMYYQKFKETHTRPENKIIQKRHRSGKIFIKDL